ncbi:MAG: hypothetical protein P1V20_30480 [Verrucomicrobiales bacterium]|nr:hypothetical protein [Verrucomicrobiales bacterium]
MIALRGPQFFYATSILNLRSSREWCYFFQLFRNATPVLDEAVYQLAPVHPSGWLYSNIDIAACLSRDKSILIPLNFM